MSQTLKTEDEIIQLLANNDRQAIPLLYDNYSPALYGVILKIVKSEETAEDVLQESFVKIWKNAQRYDSSKGRLFTWLLNIARNTAIDTIRSSRFRQSKKSQPLHNAVYNDARLSTELKVNHIGLDKVLDRLDDKYRLVIDLVYFQGYTQKEVEEELNIPLGTVKSRVRIAIRELRKILNGVVAFILTQITIFN